MSALVSVFYDDQMLAESDTRSPSAMKPKPVVEAWERAGLAIERLPIVPATYEDLCLAHDPDYVLGILTGLVENGFRKTRADVARSLPYTVGAMIGAVDHALGHRIACAPACGFHHAGYDTASMFCTFNGLVIAALRMLQEKKVRRVLILDCDFHYGNGTDDIIQRLGLANEIENVTLGRWFCTEVQAQRYLTALAEHIRRFSGFDLIIYQAGADLHVDDPLGGVLDSEQMRERDRMVFAGAKAAGVPLAWCLAGGYQEPIERVITIHEATMVECLRAYG